VLRELGLEPERIEALERAGAIRSTA
jgi:hypothetical protein